MNGESFILNPKTTEDFFNNVQFQFQNVAGWIVTHRIDNALTKAECLAEAVEELAEHLKKQLVQNHN